MPLISRSLSNYRLPLLLKCFNYRGPYLITHSFPCHSFNIVTYASTVAKWQDQLVPLSEDLCTQAVQWLQTVRAGGASCLLEALKVCIILHSQALPTCL